MIIRPIKPSDLQAVLLIEKQAMTNPWSAKMVNDEITNEHGLGYIATTDTGLSGFAFFRLVADEGEILRIAVSTKHRRGGIGSSLIYTLLAELTSRQATGCFLEVRAGNIPAITLYETTGFTTTGRRKGYYNHPREDAIILYKDLSVGHFRPGAADENNS
ncbi:MAG: ribosomal protein S18-alanine N-acetyltransferase [Desulfobulbaceae bacterium]|nr:ribosomal protein S18-alanine N-acetyltransferase [Desulfobulbaceae bacterium]